MVSPVRHLLRFGVDGPARAIIHEVAPLTPEGAQLPYMLAGRNFTVRSTAHPGVFHAGFSVCKRLPDVKRFEKFGRAEGCGTGAPGGVSYRERHPARFMPGDPVVGAVHAGKIVEV